jgi:hypothetical protein
MTPEQKASANAVPAQLNLQPSPGFEDHWGPVFSLPDGGRLYFSCGRQHGQLHISASVRAGDRATKFKSRCRQLGITGVTLHSYRCAWAERAKQAGWRVAELLPPGHRRSRKLRHSRKRS